MKRRIVIRLNAPVILSFALLSLAALLLGGWTDGATTYRYFSVYRSSLSDPLTYVRFLAMCWVMRTTSITWAICCFCCWWDPVSKKSMATEPRRYASQPRRW